MGRRFCLRGGALLRRSLHLLLWRLDRPWLNLRDWPGLILWNRSGVWFGRGPYLRLRLRRGPHLRLGLRGTRLLRWVGIYLPALRLGGADCRLWRLNLL